MCSWCFLSINEIVGVRRNYFAHGVTEQQGIHLDGFPPPLLAHFHAVKFFQFPQCRCQLFLVADRSESLRLSGRDKVRPLPLAILDQPAIQPCRVRQFRR